MLYASSMHQLLHQPCAIFRTWKNKQQRETMPNKRTPRYTNIGTYVRAFHMLPRSTIRQYKATLLKTIDLIQQTHRSNRQTLRPSWKKGNTVTIQNCTDTFPSVSGQLYNSHMMSPESEQPPYSILLHPPRWKATRQGKQIRYCFFWFLMSGTMGGRTSCNLLDVPNSRHAVSFDGVPLMPCAWTVGHLFRNLWSASQTRGYINRAVCVTSQVGKCWL
jgi:hypothetical protein